MVLTTFIKVSIAVGIITLACLIIVALLNIYWYSDEVEPALEDCVGPHLKMVANAILLLFGVIAGIVFGIGTYRLSKTSELESTDHDTISKPAVLSSKDSNEIDEMTPMQLRNSVVGYADIVKTNKQQIDGYYMKMQENLTNYLGPKPLSKPNEYLERGRNNAETIQVLYEKADENSQSAMGLYSMIENNPRFQNTSPLDEFDAGPRNDLRRLFVETRQQAFEANGLINSSREALLSLNKNIEFEYYERSKERQY